MAAAARQQRRQRGGCVGSAVAASAERRRQRGSEGATVGSAVMASAVRDSGDRDKDNGKDSDGGVHSRQSTKRGSRRDDSGMVLRRIVASRCVASCCIALRCVAALWRGILLVVVWCLGIAAWHCIASKDCGTMKSLSCYDIIVRYDTQ